MMILDKKELVKEMIRFETELFKIKLWEIIFIW